MSSSHLSLAALLGGAQMQDETEESKGRSSTVESNLCKFAILPKMNFWCTILTL